MGPRVGTRYLTRLVTQLESNAEDARALHSALSQLFYLRAVEWRFFVANGGVEALLDLMRLHDLDAGIQLICCKCFSQLGSVTHCVYSRIVAERGAVGLLLCALDNHLQDMTLSYYACLALGQLAANHAVRVLIAIKGGIELIVVAMQRHRNDGLVQAAGCSALAALAEHPPNHAIIEPRMAILFDAAAAHASSASVARECCRACCALSRSRRVQESIGPAGGLHTILNIARAHLGDASVVANACTALSTLAAHPPNAALVGPQGLHVVKSAMNMHPSSAAVQQVGCVLLAQISHFANVHGEMQIVSSMQLHPADVQLQSIACGARQQSTSSSRTLTC